MVDGKGAGQNGAHEADSIPLLQIKNLRRYVILFRHTSVQKESRRGAWRIKSSDFSHDGFESFDAQSLQGAQCQW